ncbi:MAG TPA: 5-formyltetrahydrofolate cyclo-ligase [Firmicutes bacterium]|nr:5-formyltetrahydrofolate cyclo-ligase [Bacillota bacterium]
MKKKELRRLIIDRRDQLTGEQILAKSLQIAERLFCLPAYRKAEMVMFFISFGSEVVTRPMVEKALEEGKTALAPRARPKTRELIPSRILDWDEDLAPGAYGIPEPREDKLRPCSPGDIDLLIVPGVAFDRTGNRLGYGGGYYDRFFPFLRSEVPLVALAFEIQIVPSVPVNGWDRPVDLVITEKEVIETRKD